MMQRERLAARRAFCLSISLLSEYQVEAEMMPGLFAHFGEEVV
jgi:hypothetical protein